MLALPTQVLLIAGPSGSGKSTFIRALTAGTLPAELCRLLPQAAARWPVFEANDFLKRNIPVDVLARDRKPDRGVILHFDIAFGRRLGVIDYAHDPIFEALSQADNLTVVNLSPSAVQLRAQFEGRLQDQRQDKGWARVAWRSLFHRPVRAVRRRLSGQRTIDTSRIYARPDELAQVYSQWTAFARALVSGRPGSRLLRVEPGFGVDGQPTFVLTAQPAPALV